MNTTMHCSDCFTDSAKWRWGMWKPFQGSASHRSMILGHKASSPSSGGRENPSRARTACQRSSGSQWGMLETVV